jgi:hypothetical protein
MIRTRTLAALGAAALLSANGATAGQTPAGGNVYFEGEHWVVIKDQAECTAIAEFERGDAVYLSYNRVANAAYFTVINNNFRNVRAGAEVRYDLVFLNRNRDGQSREFGNAAFYGLSLSSGQFGVTGLFNADEFMPGFENFQVVGLLNGENIVGSYNLTESREAGAALRRCDAEVERANPTNPTTGRRPR